MNTNWWCGKFHFSRPTDSIKPPRAETAPQR